VGPLSTSAKAREVVVLLALLKMRSANGSIFTSSTQLAKAIGVSQQTAVRYLKELEGGRLIRRALTARGEKVEIEDRGFSLLRETYGALSVVFANLSASCISFRGTLFTGIGEGAYYVSQRPYMGQFSAKLGFTPYPGTLNIRLMEQADQVNYLQVLSYPPTLVLGFRSADRTYGDVLCYKVSLEKRYPGAVVRSVRSLYDNSVVEIISPLRLRREMKIEDGSRISVYFTPPK
jgi:riboflavin kinase